MPFLAIRRRSILRLWIVWIISVGRERSFVHKATKPSRFFGVFSCVNRVCQDNGRVVEMHPD